MRGSSALLKQGAPTGLGVRTIVVTEMDFKRIRIQRETAERRTMEPGWEKGNGGSPRIHAGSSAFKPGGSRGTLSPLALAVGLFRSLIKPPRSTRAMPAHECSSLHFSPGCRSNGASRSTREPARCSQAGSSANPIAAARYRPARSRLGLPPARRSPAVGRSCPGTPNTSNRPTGKIHLTVINRLMGNWIMKKQPVRDKQYEPNQEHDISS